MQLCSGVGGGEVSQGIVSAEVITGLVRAWRGDPVLFVSQVFGLKTQEQWLASGANPDEHRIERWQQDALRAVASESRIAVKSGKGVGKSTWLAWCILWKMVTHLEVKIPCTATSAHQLYDVLWSEVGKWYRKMKPEYRAYFDFNIGSDRISLAGMEDVNFAVARTARKDQPEALQGFHATNLLFIIDEASGIDDIIFEVAEGGMSTKGAQTLMTGNPTRDQGYFYDAFHKDARRWKPMTVSGKDSYLVTEDYIEGIAHKYGEDSNEFRVGVLGEFPLGGSQAVIPRFKIESAVGREIDCRFYPIVWGVDVARFGDDRTALAKRKGRKLLEPVESWGGKDLMQTCGMIADRYFAAEEKPIDIVIDVIGLGAGVYDRLKELNLPVTPCNVAERKGVLDGYFMLRDELWFTVREWFETDAVSIPEDMDLIHELASVEYEFTSDMKRKIANKKQIGWSPDLADAFIMTFASERERYYNPEEGVADPSKQVYVDCNASYFEEGEI